MDRLIEAINTTQNPSVVGLDPTEALVPAQVVASFADEVRESVESEEELQAAQLAVAYYEFNRTIIDAVAGIVPAVKPQIAMYEALGPAGVDVYAMTCEYARERGLYVLADVKRGDIGSTAAAYARMLTGVGEHDPWSIDAVTVNPYLGTDGITPFVDAATEADKDLFVLVRTSNPSSSELQMLDLADGKKVYGVAGYPRGIGNWFSYDNENGVELLGYIPDVFAENGRNVCILHPTTIAISPSGKYIAVGGSDF